jgi:hypothetical protein
MMRSKSTLTYGKVETRALRQGIRGRLGGGAHLHALAGGRLERAGNGVRGPGRMQYNTMAYDEVDAVALDSGVAEEGKVKTGTLIQ